MAAHSDIEDYYRILGLPVDASVEEVKRAYRRLAKELHPDRHPNAPDVTAKFQALNEANAVLSDPEARARYDAACISAETQNEPRQSFDPVTCSSCGAVSAQVRYVIFWYVIRLILVTSRRTMQGVFCPSCASKKAFQASAITWLLGWWGFPWGPIWTVGALYRILRNGTQPADVNGQNPRPPSGLLLGQRQTRSCCRDSRSSSPSQDRPVIAAALVGAKASASACTGSAIDRQMETTPEAGFWAQVAPILAFAALITWSTRDNVITAIARHDVAHVGEVRSTVFAEPGPASQVLATIRPFQNFHVLAGWATAGFERVITDAGTVGFIPKAAIIFGDGMADLKRRCFPFGPVSLTNGLILRETRIGPHTLKTTNGLSSDAVVKLRDTAGRTVVSFYVTAGGVVTIDSVPEGTFTIEFATGREFSPYCGYFLSDMSSRRFVNAESFQTRFQGNYQYTSVLEITLNPVVGGTAQTVNTDDTTFDRD